MRITTLPFAPVVLACALVPASVDADARAERLEAVVRVGSEGALDVIETLVFTFDGGREELVRELPRRGHDGIEILEVAIDGAQVESGDGGVHVRRRPGPQIRWTFPPSESASHTIRIRYLVRGAIRQEESGDLLTWRIPAGGHKWRIDSSVIRFVLPPGVSVEPSVRVHRAQQAAWEIDAGTVRVATKGVRSNGYTEATLRMPTGAIVSAPPAWQVAQQRRASYAPAWLSAAGLAFVVLLIPVYAIRQGYDAPRHDERPRQSIESRPDTLPAPVAGAVVAGRPLLEHAAAALFALAERGALLVSEEPKRRAWSTRTYVLTRLTTRQPSEPFEAAALEVVFPEGSGGTVTLVQARTRLSKQLQPFREALEERLRTEGLLDPGRQAAKAAFGRVVAIGFALSALSFMLWPIVMETYGAWPLLVTAGLSLSALVALAFYCGTTQLSNEGVRRAEAWNAYRRYLRRAAKQGSSLGDAALPHAVALGLAAHWSKHVKAHGVPAPAWFRAGGEAGPSYAAFIAAAGAGTAVHPHGAHA